MTSPRQVVDFDHHTPEFGDKATAVYADLRSRCPVSWTESNGGHWITTRYEDVARIARDDATFSSARGDDPAAGTAIVIPRGPGLVQYPIELDPPDAVPYRDLVNPLLTREAVAALAPMIARHTDEVIDEFIGDGGVDFVAQLTNPLPTAVTLDWLGFPREDWKRLAGPVHDIFAAAPGSERAARGGAALGWMEQRIRELLADRRRTPASDVLGYLVTRKRPDGEFFDDDELVSVVFLLVAGGVDTTTSLTGSTLVYLSAHPAERERLRTDPGLLEVATEEFLRVFAPSQSMARTVTRDTEIGGCPVSRGDRVLIPWVAANFDPDVFTDPDEVRLDRNPREHLSFGIGSHRCAGAHLARAMFTSMITRVLERLPDFRVDPSALVRYESCGSQTGWDSIPATFTPAERVAGDVAVSARELTLTVTGRQEWADGVVALRLGAPDGTPLPGWEPGAHVALTLPSGAVRHYSLCGDPDDRAAYTVAVLRCADGRGGSLEVHERLGVGSIVKVSLPRNRFALTPAPWRTFVAGGIGITPILAMARHLVAAGDRRWNLVYCGRSRGSMALLEEVESLACHGGGVSVHVSDEGGRADLAALLAEAPGDAVVYCCGPDSLTHGVRTAAAGREVRTEAFGSADDVDVLGADAQAFEVELARTGGVVTVPADRTALAAVRDVLPGTVSDCEEGYCGSCEVSVLAGTPVHRDSVLTDAERAASATMMLCVSRCAGGKLVLDL